MVKIKDEELIKDLKRVKNILGKIPNQNDYNKLGKYSKNTYIIRKPWSQWLNETFGLNIKYRNIYNKISDKELLDDLIRIYKKVNRVPKITDLNYNLTCYQRAFGSFMNALKLVGFQPNQNRLLNKNDIINDLKIFYNKLGRTFTRDEFLKNGNSVKSGWVIVKHFGSWSKAISLINIKPLRKEIDTKEFFEEEIIKDIKRVYKKINKVFTRSDFINESNTTKSSTILNKQFGSWNKLLIKAGVPINKDRKVDMELLINSLKNLVKKDGINSLNYWNIHRLKKQGEFPYCCGAIKRNFPNLFWEEIMNKLGFNYKSPKQFIKKQKFIGNDNHKYLSLLEKKVGDTLYSLKKRKIINYEYNIFVCKERLWTCDFKVDYGNILWIEVDGMLNTRYKPYNSGENEKINYYIKNKYNLLIITYIDNIKKKILEAING